MNFRFPDEFGPLFALISVAVLLITVIVHIAFAVAVWTHANGRTRRPVFVSPIIWAAATLVGGVFVAALYWAVHDSTLSPTRSSAEEQP